MDTVIAYGVRRTDTGKTSVIKVSEIVERVRLGDYAGTRRVHTHRRLSTYQDAVRAERCAQQLATEANVRYAAYQADAV